MRSVLVLRRPDWKLANRTWSVCVLGWRQRAAHRSEQSSRQRGRWHAEQRLSEFERDKDPFSGPSEGPRVASMSMGPRVREVDIGDDLGDDVCRKDGSIR